MDVVSEVWSESVIDKCPVDCKPVEIGCEYVPDEPDPKWVARHVIHGRYTKQIVKCLDSNCCVPFKTNWFNVFPTRFIPKPLEVIEVSDCKERLKLDTEPLPLETAKIRFASLQERLITKLVSDEAKKSKTGTKAKYHLTLFVFP